MDFIEEVKDRNGVFYGKLYGNGDKIVIINNQNEKLIVDKKCVIKNNEIIGHVIRTSGGTVFLNVKQFDRYSIYKEEKRRKKALRRKKILASIVGGIALVASIIAGIHKLKNKGDSKGPYIPETETVSPTETPIYIPTATPTVRPTSTPTQAPTRPDNAIDVALIEYKVQSGDVLKTITTKKYYENIKNALIASGVTDKEDLDQYLYYYIEYFYKTIAKINMKKGIIPNMNTLNADQTIYIPDPEAITAETVDKICSCGPDIFSVDLENKTAVIVPDNTNEKTTGVSKH